MRKAVLALAVLSASILNTPAHAQVLDANVQGPYDVLFSNSFLYRAQTFTVLQSGKLTRFEAFLSGTGTSLFEIWNVSAGAPVAINSNPTVLASATVTFASVVGAFAGADISAANLNVQAGEVYALVQIGGQSTGGLWHANSAANYAGGNAFTTLADAPNGAWEYPSSGSLTSFGFQTFVQSASVPEPSSLGLIAFGLLGLMVARRRA